MNFTTSQQESISKLIDLGKSQGYLTHSQVVDILPKELITEERLEPIIDNIFECDILLGTEEPVDIDLRLITLKSFVEDFNLSVRIKNAIAESSKYFDYGTLHDFINNNDNHALLRRTPNLGKGSINELIDQVDYYIEYNNIIENSQEDKLNNDETSSIKKQIDKAISESLSNNQEKALKSISIAFFANNSKDLDVRTMNCLIEAEKNSRLERFFENLYDLYVAPSKIKNLLFNLPNFGKHSLVKLNIALANLVDDEKQLKTFAELCNKAPEILGDYESINDLLEREISLIDNERSKEVIKLRFLTKKKPTLQELGVMFGVTRERIRQIEKTTLLKIQSSLQTRFNKDELSLWSQDKFEKFFFKKNSFISLKTAKKILDNEDEPTYINLFIQINSKKLENFLSVYFEFNQNFNGWFLNNQVNLNNDIEAQSLSLDEASLKSKWPIKLSSISSACNLPDEVIKDQIFLSDKLELYEHSGENYIKFIDLSKSIAIRLALNSHKNALTFLEIQTYLLETFGINMSIRLISARLNYMPEAILVERGANSKYTSLDGLDISDKIMSNLKEFVHDFLMEKQEYISASIIFRELLKRKNSSKFEPIKSSYILYEICKVDSKFINARGSMLGLKNKRFKGVFTPLIKEYINLMKKYSRPLTVREIVDEISSTRTLNEAAVFTQLNNDIHGFFKRVGNGFYLADDKSHLEIDESKFEEYEFDDL